MNQTVAELAILERPYYESQLTKWNPIWNVNLFEIESELIKDA